jgi:rubredoxin
MGMSEIRAASTATIKQDGVRIIASTTHGLLEHIRQKRRNLRKLVEELRSPYSNARVIDHFDGFWSPTTQSLVERLNATGIELNQWWAMLKPDWKCPCCGRGKDEIAHKTASGVLIAKVVDHHDHFGNFINRTFRERLGPRWNSNPDRRPDVMRVMNENFLAFDNAIICESCNKADRDAKMALVEALRLGADFMEAFSFAVDEIRFFITSGRHQHHKVDVRRVLKLFTERRKLETFEFRKKAVAEQVELLAHGVHWRSPERHPGREDVNSEASDMLDNMGLNTGDNFDLIETSCTARRGEEALHVWRKSGQQKLPMPTNAEVAAFLGSAPEWQNLPTGWTCPCCGRPPKYIVRFSKDRTLHGRLSHLGTYTEQILVCMDCKDIANGLAREAGVDVRLLLPAELRPLLTIRRHQRHKVTYQIAADRMVERVRARLAPTRVATDDGFDADGFVAI